MKVYDYLKCCFGIENYGRVDEELVKWKFEILCCNCCGYQDYFLRVMTPCGLKNIYQLLKELRDTMLKEKKYFVSFITYLVTSSTLRGMTFLTTNNIQ